MYLGYTLSYQGEADIPNTIAKYTITVVILNTVLKPSMLRRHT